MGCLAFVTRRRSIGLRKDAVGRISVAPSGTKAGMAPEVSCPAALRLPGRGVGFRGAFREKTPVALK
ncbi:hypothetical protein CK204_16450 [Klebsiella pneumoniae]|nr:hypothetical protein CK204_16450 [Klebsiella pneumoniae]